MLTVDYLLGDNRNRYFGRGYKRTTYEVNTLRKSLPDDTIKREYA